MAGQLTVEKGLFSMDNRIAVITSSDRVAKTVKGVLKEKELEHPVYVAETEKSCDIARKCISEGTRIIISRGWSAATLLMENFDIPIVNMRHTYFDFVYCIRKALAYSHRVAFVGYSNVWQRALDKYTHKSENPLERGIAVVGFKDRDEIGHIIKDLKARGTEVIVGGMAAAVEAKKHGLPSVLIDVEKDVVEDAVKEAQHLLKIDLEREEKYETIKSILNCTFEGVIGVDTNGTITSINDIAINLLDGGKVGSSITELMPVAVIQDTINTGVGVSGKLINVKGCTLTLNSMPVSVGNKMIGAVVTFQEATQIQRMEQKIRNKLMKKGHVAKKTFDDIIGSSQKITAVKEKAKKFARTDSTILIMGETGTGKEVFAQSIHNYSPRKNAPFVAINCGALPKNILESELFGYVKGAFTGARSEGKPGIFELAHTGTILLDEISEMPLDVQVRFLRVIQEKEVTRIGDDRVIPIDVRILASSNKDLSQQVREGRFREDLYYRLGVLELVIPPLRTRKEDIEELANNLIERKIRSSKKSINRVTPRAMNMLVNMDWPGNVRQLGNIVERSIILSADGIIDGSTIREATAAYRPENGAENIESNATAIPGRGKKHGDISPAEAQLIKEALSQVKGNRKLAAQKLGISTTTLWRRIKKIEAIDPHFFDLVYYNS